MKQLLLFGLLSNFAYGKIYVSKLPACNFWRNNDLGYISADQSLHYCSDGKWHPIKVKGEKGDPGKDGKDGRASQV